MGLSTVQAHKPCSISLVPNIRVDLAHYRLSSSKDWVSVDCGTILYISSCFAKVNQGIMAFVFLVENK